MIVNLKTLMEDAQKRNYAVGGFNAPDFATLEATIEAAEDTKTPVILSHAALHDEFLPLEEAAERFKYFAEKTSIPICLHVDHAITYDYAVKALRYGFTSIMYDCAHMEFEENIREVTAFTKLAHTMGVSVEAEVGRMPSSIEGHGGCSETGVAIENIEQYYSVPEDVAEFVRRTGVDAITVSFGTIHGISITKPVLDIGHLKKLKEATGCPLVMHGGSGVSREDITKAINNGIRKINFYTEMSRSPLPEIAQKLKEDDGSLSVPIIYGIMKRAMKSVLIDRIRLFNNT